MARIRYCHNCQDVILPPLSESDIATSAPLLPPTPSSHECQCDVVCYPYIMLAFVSIPNTLTNVVTLISFSYLRHAEHKMCLQASKLSDTIILKTRSSAFLNTGQEYPYSDFFNVFLVVEISLKGTVIPFMVFPPF